MAEDARLRELRTALQEGEDIVCVHYACEDLNEAKDHPPAVSCVAIANAKDDTCVAFSRSDALPEMSEADAEIDLLRRFYGHLAALRDARVVHWNMNSSTYGFDALALRYRYLTSEDPAYEPPQRLLYDLDTIIGSMFGEVYVRHPKMASLAALNRLGMRSFLAGGDEAKRYSSKDFGSIARSTITKSRIIVKLLLRLVDGHLQTQTSVGSVVFARERLDAVTVVLELGERFLYVKRSLAKRHGKRETILVNDEYDAQDLLHSLLRIFFEDVRPESWTPTYAGGGAKVDFLLPEYNLAVELKYGRDGLAARELADQLIVDRDRYKEDARISHLICLVFDYDGHLDGPRGLEADLSKESSTEGLAVTVRIYDR